MPALVKKSMKDQIYEIIKAKIINQDYKPGDAINIITLSKELSISNTPIREALAVLSSEGLVTSTLNAKFRVIELNEPLITSINQSALVMVLGSYEEMSSSNRSELVKALTNALENQQRALDTDNLENFTNYSIAFDRCFIEATKNERLIMIFDNISTLLLLAVRYNHQKSKENCLHNIMEHKKILAAAVAGEREDVISLLKEHYNKHY